MGKVEQNKKRLLVALEECKGIVTDACKAAGVSRTSFYDYTKKDPDFKKAVDDVENIAIDHVEGKLFKLIDELNAPAIIFYLKCKGKKRGYIEKQEVEHSGKVDNGGIIVKTASKEDIAEVKKLINGN